MVDAVTDADPPVRHCPVCQCRSATPLHDQHLVLPDGLGLPHQFDVVACRRCGMVFSDIASSERAMSDYYRAETYTFGRTTVAAPSSDRLSYSAADRTRLNWLADYLAARYPPTTSVLDVGCASGALLSMLRARGFTRLQGLDPSPQAAAEAGRTGLQVRIGSLGNVPHDIGVHDLVILSHVLEHVHDTVPALSALRQVLDDGGHIYVEVPDAERHADFLVEPFDEFGVEHINHFSAAHLDALLSSWGFSRLEHGRRTFPLVVDDWAYPAVHGRWILTERTPCGGVVPAANGNLAAAVARYVTGSQQLVAGIDRWLGARLQGRRRLAVRGVGHRAWILLGSTSLSKVDVGPYVDASSAKQAWTIGGRPVLGPEVGLPSGLPVLVLAYHLDEEIRDEYRRLGDDREVLCLGRSSRLADAA